MRCLRPAAPLGLAPSHLQVTATDRGDLIQPGTHRAALIIVPTAMIRAKIALKQRAFLIGPGKPRLLAGVKWCPAPPSPGHGCDASATKDKEVR
jgi:hypothetical protein